MKNINARTVAFLCAFFACTSVFAAAKKKPAAKSSVKAAPAPAWVNAPASVYPNSEYISYVGSSSDRNTAELNAVQGLAAIFGQAVKSESTGSQRMVQAQADGKVATAKINDFNQKIKRNVDQDCLIGIEIKEFWHDESEGDGSWYAVALLDKAKAVSIYSEMIKKNSSAISFMLEHHKDDPASIDKFAYFDFAEDIAKQNEKFLSLVSVINDTAAESLKSFCPSSKQLHEKKMEIANKITIGVVVSGQDVERVMDAYIHAVSSLGFKAMYNLSNVRYYLHAQSSFEESPATDKKTVRCSYRTQSYILDTQTEQQIVPFTVSGRESHISEYSEAQKKALKKMEEKIKSEYSSKFAEYLAGIAYN